MTAYLPSAIYFRMAPPKKRVKVQRLEIHLEPSLLAWLRREAKRRDVPLAEVIRVELRKLKDGP